MRAACACLSLLLFVRPLEAQLTLGVTGGTVTYEQSSAIQSLGISPEFRLERHGLVLDLAGGYTSGSDGSRSLDGSGTLWRSTAPALGHLRLDGLLQAAHNQPHLDSASTEFNEFGEVTWSGEDGGFGVGGGAAQGTIAGSGTVNALRSGARAWYDFGSVEGTITVQPTRLAGSWYTDYVGGISLSRRLVDIGATARLRQISASPSSVGGDGSVAWHLRPRSTIEFDFGRHLRDPLQGLPAGSYASLEFLWQLWVPKGGLREGESETDLGDLQVAAAQSLGFTKHGNSSNRGTTQVPSSHGSGNGGGTGRGHKP